MHWGGGHDSAVKGYGLRVSPPSVLHPSGKSVFVAHGGFLQGAWPSASSISSGRRWRCDAGGADVPETAASRP